jgi:hypothetical protein
MAERHHIETSLNELLRPEGFKDYGPNGLQVEGRPEVRLIVSGVTASLAFIDAALAAGADALLVHHGLFWRGQDGRLTGWLKQRVARAAGGWHQPVRLPPAAGRASPNWATTPSWACAWACGRRTLRRPGPGLHRPGRTCPQRGGAGAGRAGRRWAERRCCCRVTAGRCGVWPGAPAARRATFEAAIAAGADAYLTGELSEPQAHLARETGVAYLACGHHATERYGAPAVAAWVAARQFGVEHRFIEIDNPA